MHKYPKTHQALGGSAGEAEPGSCRGATICSASTCRAALPRRLPRSGPARQDRLGMGPAPGWEGPRVAKQR